MIPDSAWPRWTDADDELLLSNPEASVATLAVKLHRNRPAVHARRHRLRAINPTWLARTRRYTPEEHAAFLAACAAGTEALTQLATTLGRPLRGLQRRAYVLKVSVARTSGSLPGEWQELVAKLEPAHLNRLIIEKLTHHQQQVARMLLAGIQPVGISRWLQVRKPTVTIMLRRACWRLWRAVAESTQQVQGEADVR